MALLIFVLNNQNNGTTRNNQDNGGCECIQRQEHQ
jgi:hypothetical protein